MDGGEGADDWWVRGGTTETMVRNCCLEVVGTSDTLDSSILEGVLLGKPQERAQALRV